MRKSKATTGRAALSLAALGIVYGDIGTSPLYAIHEIFASHHHPVGLTPDNVLGILSLVFWSLTIVVSIKYVAFILKADNRGEGGIMALLALVNQCTSGRPKWMLGLLGIFGAALFYGDGMITPAISVMSAVEGLEVAAPSLDPYIVPIALVILFLLFLYQRHGTAKVGRLFGPVMVVWFSTLGLLGLRQIVEMPGVLKALSPTWAFSFLATNPGLGFLSLGAVVLVVTGAEALYADMGHLGRGPIRRAWFGLVLPALVLNYFGQGALLLNHPEAIENPFFMLAPSWALYPLIALATLATVIASQAVITGVYSVTLQAMQLGYAPRFEVQHTSSEEFGQIYLPGINWALFVAVAVLVLSFRSSSNLASAYGIAVTCTMLIDTLLAWIVARHTWGWHPAKATALFSLFALVDITYVSANSVKITSGGWFPLVLGGSIFLLLTTWKRGRQLLSEHRNDGALPLEPFLAGAGSIPRNPGTAVYMTHNPTTVPRAMLHSLKHFKSLHERVIILNIASANEPYVDPATRVRVDGLSANFYRVTVNYGFMDKPDIPAALELCAPLGLDFNMLDTSFFLGRDTLVTRDVSGSAMTLWRLKLFATLFRNASSPTAYFNLPPNRVVELGAQVTI
jgi:KUP system potassium uptake protein